MSEQVNLLQQVKILKKENNKLLTFSFLFLLITIVVAVSILLYLFFLKNQEGTIIDSQAESRSSFVALQDKKIMYQSTKERLLAISELMKTKNIQVNRFIGVSLVIPVQVEISTLSISGDVAKMTLVSTSLVALNEFLERNLEELTVREGLGIRRIQIDSLEVQGDQGQYSVGVTIEFS